MIRILQVLPCLELGGTEAFVMNHYRATDRTKYKFDFLVFAEKDYPYLEEIKKLGGKVYFSCPPTPYRMIAFFKIMKKAIQENGPYEAIHCHANIANSWVLVCAKILGIHVRVSHSHGIELKETGSLKRFYRHLQRVAIRWFATDHLACSLAAGKSLYGNKWPKKTGQVFSNGINVENFANVDVEQAEGLRKEFGIPETCDLIVANITRFDSNKNQGFAIGVFNEILRSKPNAVLLLGGPDGGELESIKIQVKHYGIEENVRFIGPRKDVYACLQLIDIYLFPSIAEGLPIALLEAQAAGCFCMVSDTVSREVDVGMKNILFLSLKSNYKVWADELIIGWKNYAKPPKEKVFQAFETSGFSLSLSIRQLVKVYSNEE